MSDKLLYQMATHVMLGNKKISDFVIDKKLKGFAIKVPVFSFNKFPGVDKNLGPEMKSTGEMIYYIKDIYTDENLFCK